MKDTQHIYDRFPLPLDGKKARCLYDPPQKPDRAREQKAEAGKGYKNGQQRPPARVYPCISPALPDHLKRRRRKHELEVPDKCSPARCRDGSRPGLAAYARAHELGYTQAEHWRDLLIGLLHDILEARCGAGGSGHE